MNLRQDYNPHGASRRTTGLMVVVLLHVLIAWGLASGLARKAVEAVRKPIEMRIVDEVRPPPPPPPPPAPVPKPVQKIKDPPKVPAPPPPFVPPPEVRPVAPPPAPAIQAVQSEPPRQPVDPKPAPPPPAPAPAAPPRPERLEVGVACPGYREILQSALAGAYDRVGVEGVVRVQFRLRDGKIVDVATLSGPREYHRAVQSAVRRFACRADTGDEVVVSLEVAFREQ